MLPEIEVPANASRFFDSFEIALAQPMGTIEITYDCVENYYYNSKFDSSLIFQDSNYYTKDSFQLTNSINIFNPLIKKYDLLNIIDIGCGQGEYVKILNKLGNSAMGYDPVLKESTSNLKSESFHPEMIEDKSEKTFIMRCVLPHIENPFLYLDSIFLHSPKSKIYIEFQRLEWILINKAWTSICHDHVSLFTIGNFVSRYNIIDSGAFARGEWGFVLFCKKEKNHLMVAHKGDNTSDKHLKAFKSIFESRSQQLNDLIKYDKPILIYGGAAKGTIFSHAFKSNGGRELFCIDSDSGRQGKYLELSGVEVISPETALSDFDLDTLILVMNKNHIESVNKIFDNSSRIISLNNFSIGFGS